MKDANYKHRPLIAMSTTGRLQPVTTQKSPQNLRPRVRVQVQITPPEEISPDQPSLADQEPEGSEASYGVTAPSLTHPAAPTEAKSPFHFLKTLFAR
jgi:hypothetical protein